ncbi:Bifunctional epoxide hydrolase 2 [Phytophthora nicotianae]|nr:Bifunctional epoxide hydrolase 2 [Phytophthora nicotianae]
MPSKPDKYGVRFYAVVGWDSLYVHSLWDNSSGNTTPSTPAERYTRLFPSLRTPLYNTLRSDDVSIEATSATAMWIAMAGHQTQSFRSPTGHRLVVSDNFYTRHTFAQALLKFTDGEMHLLGTVRINLVDKWNKPAVSAAIGRVDAGNRGSWELVAAVNPEPGWEAKQKGHQKRQRGVAKAKQTAFEPTIVQAQNAGYIIYKDRKVVIFYTNDLKATPSERSLPSTSPEAVYCCHGTYPIQRWTEDRMLHREIFMAPTVISAYNLCMNAVDRVDQLRSTNPTRRREKRLGMTIFTWMMDLAVINAHTLLTTVRPTATQGLALREFKRRIAEVLTSGERQNKTRRASQKKKRARETLDEIVGIDSSIHMITPNSTAHSSGKLLCHLCSLRNIKKKSRYGCTKCELGFHVECFTAFHNQAVLQHSPQLRATLEVLCRASTEEPETFTRKKRNRTITPVEQLKLPEN